MKRRLTARPTLIGLCLIVGLLVAPSGTAHAAASSTHGSGKKQPGVSVGIRPATAKGGDPSRPSFEYEIPPQGRVIDYVAVSNLRYQPVTVRLLAKDATTTTGSPFAVQKSDQAPQDVGSWIALQKSVLTVPARSEVVVPFQLGVPADATPGDHTGAIVVSLLAREPKPTGGTIIVDHRIGLRVLLRVPGDYRATLAVTGLKATWDGPGSVLGRGRTVVTYTLTNTGNLRLKATQDIALTRILGLPSVDVAGPAVAEIQPGGSIKVRQVIDNVLGTGPMNAHVTVHPSTVDPKLKDITVKTVVATTSFAAWPWLLILLVIGLLLLGAAGWRFERRRRTARKAAMAPTGGKYRAPVAPDAPSGGDKILVRVVLAATGACFALLGLGAPASADTVPVWQAHGSIQQGSDNSPFDIITTGGCPRPGTNVVAFAFGKGFPKEGGVVVGNGDAGVSATGPFDMPLVSSMQQLMAMQPNPSFFTGDYRIELRCVTPDLQDITGKYIFAIRFTDAHHWKVAPPLTTKKGPIVKDAPSVPSTDPTTGPTGSGAGSPGSTSSPTQQQLDAAQQRAAQLSGVQNASAATTKSDPNWPLIGGGLAVLAVSGFVLFRRNRA